MDITKKAGHQCSLKRVQKIMKVAGIRSIIHKRYRSRKSNHLVLDRKNLLEQNFTTERISEKWVADITYIHIEKNGWCYLSSVMNMYSKKTVGHSFPKR